MTRQEGFALLESLGYYREAVTVIKEGSLTCGLSDRAWAVSEILQNHCFVIISRSGATETFYFGE